ncbi:MAG: 30S ribosomal protein S6 [Dehalococcoidales bacterium]|nr:30S ribosomal protein S6 [Dehalococcoidales bacterium]
MVTENLSITEERQLRDYELVVVISPEVAGENLEAAIDNVTRLIIGKGGIVSDTERWGQRKLAYPIRHFMEGSYVLFKLRLSPSAGKEVEASLRVSQEVLRHLLIRLGE